MSSPDPAIEFVLQNEGGLEEDMADPGGITNRGISLRFLREVSPEILKRIGIFNSITEQTIRDLTLDQTKLLYRLCFWDEGDFNVIVNQDIANYIFDSAVNMGISTAIRILQRALNAVRGSHPIIAVDGIFGNATEIAVNLVPWMILLKSLKTARIAEYHAIVERNPGEEKYINAWVKRAQL